MPLRGNFAGYPNLIAAYDEAPGGGDIKDINAPRNAPALTPEQHLQRLIFHSSLFQWEVALEATVPVTHTLLASKTTRIGATGYIPGGGTAGVYTDVIGDIRTSDIELASHDAGSGAIAMVAYQGRMLPSGHIVQSGGAGLRQVAPWCDATGVYLRETAVSGSSDLPEVTRSYRVMVFRNRSSNPALPLMSGDDTFVQMARGLLDTRLKYAKQVAVGEAPYALNLGPTLDIDNGRVRSATGGAVVTETGYGGSLSTPDFRNIGL